MSRHAIAAADKASAVAFPAPRVEILQTLLDQVSEGVLAVDQNGTGLAFNSAAERILRRDLARTTLAQWAERSSCYLPDRTTLCPPDQLPIARAMRGEAVQETVLFVRYPEMPEGFWVSVNAQPMHSPGGGFAGAIVVFRDISETQRTRVALKRSEDTFRAVVEAVQDVISIVDAQGNIRFVSAAIKDALGYVPEELVGRNVFDLFHPEDLPRVLDVFRGSIERPGAVHGVDVRARHKDGSWRFFAVAGKNLLEHPEVAGVVAIARDVTEHKEAEERLKASQEQLRQLAAHNQSILEAERARIARDVHDELGQQLTALKIDLFQLSKDLSARTAARKLAPSISPMIGLVDSIMDSVRRIAAELRPGVLDDLGLAAAVNWQLQEFQSRTRIRCSLNHTEEDFSLEKECSIGVFRVFQEILTNVARHAHASAVKVGIKRENGGLALEVQDNGRGITKRQITDPGSLGLLGMRERALHLGGELSVRGIRGKGTWVSLRVPIAGPESKRVDNENTDNG